MLAWNDKTGKTVTVFDRYFFAVPVRGIITGTNHDSFKVQFFANNPGGQNVKKHDGSWFLKGQCHVDEIETAPEIFLEDAFSRKIVSKTSEEPTHEQRCNLWWETDEGEWHRFITYKNGFYYYDLKIEGVDKTWFENRRFSTYPPPPEPPKPPAPRRLKDSPGKPPRPV